MIHKIFIAPSGYHPLGLHKLSLSQRNSTINWKALSFLMPFWKNFYVLRAIKSLKLHVFTVHPPELLSCNDDANHIHAVVNFICI